ncbi:MAG: hypothetical protein O3B31_08005 [Chloroflexi bacterium]|nr:hypothetical protein [Chloroflexota bacterium]MDA1003276.1 hypothetical protein [Chloroflexota bacterium]
MAFGAVSWSNFDANGSFVRGALAPGGRAQASTRAGTGERVALSSGQPALGGAKPLGVMRNLRAVRGLLGTHQSLGELTRDLREMPSFVRSVQGAPLSEETRAALSDRIAGLNSRLREGAIAQDSGREYRASVVPAFTAAAAPTAAETRSRLPLAARPRRR